MRTVAGRSLARFATGLLRAIAKKVLPLAILAVVSQGPWRLPRSPGPVQEADRFPSVTAGRLSGHYHQLCSTKLLHCRVHLSP